MITSEAGARDWIAALPEASTEKLEKLELFASLLIEENLKQNLIAQATIPDVWQRHLADSAQLISLAPRGAASWLDLGTGAGFPGLVVATLLNDCDITLVESRAKRAAWLFRASEALGLLNVNVVSERVERWDSDQFEVISARAFAPLEKLIRLSARFSTAQTTWLLPKGRSATQELLSLTGWGHTFHVEQSMTDPEAGIIVGKLLGQKGHRV